MKLECLSLLSGHENEVKSGVPGFAEVFLPGDRLVIPLALLGLLDPFMFVISSRFLNPRALDTF